jgi:hypothetical protein
MLQKKPNFSDPNFPYTIENYQFLSTFVAGKILVMLLFLPSFNGAFREHFENPDQQNNDSKSIALTAHTYYIPLKLFRFITENIYRQIKIPPFHFEMFKEVTHIEQ